MRFASNATASPLDSNRDGLLVRCRIPDVFDRQSMPRRIVSAVGKIYAPIARFFDRDII